MVTFMLDLSGPLCLMGYVNNGEEYTVFHHDDLIMDGDEDDLIMDGDGDGYSFVPALPLKEPGAVRFCGFMVEC